MRWYEFRIDKARKVSLHQQGTYAPDGFFRWMASPAIDRLGNIGIGYSFGGTPHFAGQRFAGRLADDPPGVADAARNGPGRRGGGADEHAALGGLHHDRDGSVRRLHDLVRRRLPEEGRRELLDEDRRVPHAGLRPGGAAMSDFDADALKAAIEADDAAAVARVLEEHPEVKARLDEPLPGRRSARPRCWRRCTGEPRDGRRAAARRREHQPEEPLVGGRVSRPGRRVADAVAGVVSARARRRPRDPTMLTHGGTREGVLLGSRRPT